MTEDEAKERLAALEKPRHAREAAWNAFKVSEYTGDPEKIAAAKTFYEQALAAETTANVSQRDIDRAAHDVLTARGEAHTEENVLEPGKHNFSDEDRKQMEELNAAVIATKLGTAAYQQAKDNYKAVVGLEWVEGGH